MKLPRWLAALRPGPGELAGWAALLLPVAAGYAFHVAAHLWGRPLAFQDDMRQHLLGLRPTADLFGAYFAATVPFGIGALDMLTSLFFDALFWARWLQPLLIGVWLAFAARRLWVSLRGHGSTAWTLAAWLQVFAWSGDDLVSSTPRAWAMAFLVEILASAAAGRPARLALGIALASLWYPSVAVLGWVAGAGMAAWRAWWVIEQPAPVRAAEEGEAPAGPAAPRLSWRRELLPWGAALLLSAAALLAVAKLYDRRLEPFGPKITRVEAADTDEFRGGGRAAFFSSSVVSYWITNSRGGLVNRDSEIPWLVVAAFGVMAIAGRPKALAPVLPSFWRGHTGQWLTAWLGASALLFFAAHGLWNLLFHPSRYIQYSITIFAALLLAAGAVHWRWPAQAAAMAAVFALALYLGNPSYDDGRAAGAIQYALGVPERTVVAAYPESPISATVPLLFGVRTAASVELSLPYHLGFYRPAAGRIRDAFTAWYSDDPAKVWAFQEKYGVTHWVLEGPAWAGREHGFTLHKPWRDLVPKRLGEIPKPVLARIYEGRATGGPVIVPAAEMAELLRLWPRPAPALNLPNLRLQR